MLGGMLAAHQQCGGEMIERDGKKYKCFYGTCSAKSMRKHDIGIDEYRAPEGKIVELPYRGDVTNTVNDILGSLRSACTFVNAAKLEVTQ